MALTKITRKMAEEALSNWKEEGKIQAANAVETGFLDLDHALGGLRNGETYLLAAFPVQGKTAFALNVAEHLAIDGQKKVAFFPGQLGREEIIRRCLQLILNRDFNDVGDLLGEEKSKELEAAMDRLEKAELYVEDCGISEERAQEAFPDVSVDLIILDNSQNMKKNTAGAGYAGALRQISNVARKYHVPVLLLHCLEEKKVPGQFCRPALEDLGCPEIAESVDHVIFLTQDYSEKLENGNYVTRLDIAKNRHGSPCTVLLEWNPEHMRFGTMGEGRK